MYGIIYLITNQENEKQYVGQTTRTLEARWLEHRTSAKSGLLYAGIRKHGAPAFVVSVLEECDSQQRLDTREQYWIGELNTLVPNGYNLTLGGSGSGRHCEGTRTRISESLKGKPKTVDMRRKTSEWQAGRKLSESHREAISRGKTGKKIGSFSEDHKEKISKSLTGRTISDETRKKMSLAARNRKNRAR